MRIAPFVALLLAATPAAADPTCNVRVVRAPDDVRAAIEARVGIESSCVTLDVRVVPTEDGYYVIASPPHGDVFEGSVRDPSLVGELVTGWARLPPSPEIEQGPSTKPVLVDAHDAAPVSQRRETRDIAIGGIVTSNAYGARGEVDVFVKRGWSLGIALGISEADWSWTNPEMPTTTELTFQDMRGVIVAAKTFGDGPWRLRVQGGIGVLRTQYSGTLSPTPGLEVPESGEGLTRMAEAAVTASHDVGPDWALSIGPILTYYGQTYHLDAEIIPPQETTRSYDVGAYAALHYRL